MSVPLQIKTKESASGEQLTENVLANLAMIENFIDTRYAIHNREAHLISFGKSFRDDPDGMIKQMAKDSPNRRKDIDIFCVKHCLPLFEDLEIKPTYAVMLDPRAADGVSTLGHRRKDLLKVYPETTYLIATMTHPSITEYLLENGANVVGWHSACEAMKSEAVQGLVPSWVTGGSCSAMRAVSLAYICGFRTFRMGGYDGIISEPIEKAQSEGRQVAKLIKATGIDFNTEQTEAILNKIAPAIEFYGGRKAGNLLQVGNEDGKPQSIVRILDNYASNGKLEAMKLSIGDEIMWVTPELAAMAQDLEVVFRQNKDQQFFNYSGGLCGAMYRALGGADKINPRSFLD
jgi:hypothetical protein